MASLLLAIIYLAFISLGLPDSLLGAGWPVMHGFFGVPLSWAGVVSMIISVGTVVSSLLSERLTKRFSARHVTLVSVALTALALFGFSLSARFWMLCLWAVPYGLGAGSIDAALNNYGALHYTSLMDTSTIRKVATSKIWSQLGEAFLRVVPRLVQMAETARARPSRKIKEGKSTFLVLA